MEKTLVNMDLEARPQLILVTPSKEALGELMAL
jgi:hypothetical protein